MKFKLAAIAAAMILSAPAAHAQVVLTAGGGISRGDFGSSRTSEMANASIGARWSSGDTTFQASIPYVAINTPGVVLTGFDGTPLIMLPDAGGPRRSNSGIGDPTFAASHAVSVGAVRVTGTGRVKVPVQGFNAISTGELDWSVGAQASIQAGRVSPFAAVTWRSFGNPDGWTIRDGIATSLGVSGRLGAGSAAVSWEHARSTSDFVSDADEIVAVYDAPVSDRMRLAAYGTVGLSDGAPGLGAGLRLSFTL